MLVTLSFYLGDQDLTLKLAEWIQELGGAKEHKLLLCHDPRCPEDTVKSILERFTASFERVIVHKAGAALDGWPHSANYLFRTCADRIKTAPFTEFLWLEPDAVPLKTGWLDKIEAEYKKCGKLFMGNLVEVQDVPVHMSGIGVYENPIYKTAGEAYRAHEIAWDVAARDQILPNAHWTKLIVHNWKHEPFKNQSELDNLLYQHPECVLFHSDKSGSIIDLMRQQLSPVQVQTDETQAGSEKELVPSLSTRTMKTADAVKVQRNLETEEARYSIREQRQGDISCDIFIRTYPKDYQWLAYCLKSVQKFAKGFRKIVIVSTESLPAPTKDVEWITVNDESEDGYLAQQITKVYADVITKYESDYILHIDSDVILTTEVRPEDFLKDGKIQWLYTPYAAIAAPWKPIIEKFMGKEVEYEFMRRFPIMIPKWLYSKFREFCHKTHGQVVSDYIRAQPYREFSEFNALGAYAFYYHRNEFSWLETTQYDLPPLVARQFFSWNGVNEDVKKEIETILSGAVTEKRTGDPVKVSSQPMTTTAKPPAQKLRGTAGSVSGDPPEPGARTAVPLPLTRTVVWDKEHPLASTTRHEMLGHIEVLRDYAERSHGNRVFVMKRLSMAGLKSKYKTKRKKK